MHASASQLVLVVLLIGWERGANFLSQSCGVENAKLITFRHSNENRSRLKFSRWANPAWHIPCGAQWGIASGQAGRPWFSSVPAYQVSRIYLFSLICVADFWSKTCDTVQPGLFSFAVSLPLWTSLWSTKPGKIGTHVQWQLTKLSELSLLLVQRGAFVLVFPLFLCFFFLGGGLLLMV